MKFRARIELSGKTATHIREKGDALSHPTLFNGHLPSFLTSTCLRLTVRQKCS
jgi:hypothetical protein